MRDDLVVGAVVRVRIRVGASIPVEQVVMRDDLIVGAVVVVAVVVLAREQRRARLVCRLPCPVDLRILTDLCTLVFRQPAAQRPQHLLIMERLTGHEQAAADAHTTTCRIGWLMSAGWRRRRDLGRSRI